MVSPSLSDVFSSFLVRLVFHIPFIAPSWHSLAKTRLIKTVHALITEYDDRLTLYFQHITRILFYIERRENAEIFTLHEATILSVLKNHAIKFAQCFSIVIDVTNDIYAFYSNVIIFHYNIFITKVNIYIYTN